MLDAEKQKRKAVSVTIRQDLIQQAKSLSLNTSRAAENGIKEAIRKEQERKWLEENRSSIEAYNKWIHENGLPIKPEWMAD